MRLIRRSVEILRKEGVAAFFISFKWYIFHRIRSVWYGLGSRRVCSICGWKGRKFEPFGVERRPDAACPECGSKERHRLLWEYLSEECSCISSAKVLYFAPVDGLEQQLREIESTTVTTTDLLQEDVDVRADITDLPFDDRDFDLIICSHVLEHVPDDDVAIKELYRVLTEDGKAIVLVPQDRERSDTYEDPEITTAQGRAEAFGQSDHVRWYGRDVEDILCPSGFRVSTIDYVEQLDDDYVNTYGLEESDKWIHSPTLIFRCSKDQSK